MRHLCLRHILSRPQNNLQTRHLDILSSHMAHLQAKKKRCEFGNTATSPFRIKAQSPWPLFDGHSVALSFSLSLSLSPVRPPARAHALALSLSRSLARSFASFVVCCCCRNSDLLCGVNGIWDFFNWFFEGIRDWQAEILVVPATTRRGVRERESAPLQQQGWKQVRVEAFVQDGNPFVVLFVL